MPSTLGTDASCVPGSCMGIAVGALPNKLCCGKAKRWCLYYCATTSPHSLWKMCWSCVGWLHICHEWICWCMRKFLKNNQPVAKQTRQHDAPHTLAGWHLEVVARSVGASLQTVQKIYFWSTINLQVGGICVIVPPPPSQPPQRNMLVQEKNSEKINWWPNKQKAINVAAPPTLGIQKWWPEDVWQQHCYWCVDANHAENLFLINN